MSAPDLMIPGHSLWPAFLAELAKAARCNLTTEHARAVLESMAGIEVEESLRRLAERGGTCDCAILFDLSAPPVATMDTALMTATYIAATSTT